MSPHGVTFRFERLSPWRWNVLSGQILLAELSIRSGLGANPDEHWRLRALGGEAPAEACWEADSRSGCTRSPLPQRVKRQAIECIADWTLDALSEAAQVNALLRRRLEASTEWLGSYRESLRCAGTDDHDNWIDTNEDGDWVGDSDRTVFESVNREIEANRAALARTRTKDKEGSA